MMGGVPTVHNRRAAGLMECFEGNALHAFAHPSTSPQKVRSLIHINVARAIGGHMHPLPDSSL
jgi:hypothetical protein